MKRKDQNRRTANVAVVDKVPHVLSADELRVVAGGEDVNPKRPI